MLCDERKRKKRVITWKNLRACVDHVFLLNMVETILNEIIYIHKIYIDTWEKYRFKNLFYLLFSVFFSFFKRNLRKNPELWINIVFNINYLNLRFNKTINYRFNCIAMSYQDYINNSLIIVFQNVNWIYLVT